MTIKKWDAAIENYFRRMIFLLLSILCSVALGFVMKFFARFGIDTLQAIVVNYATCVACATVHKGEFPIQSTDFSLPWWPFAVGLGLFFITGFNGAAATVKHFGLTVAAIVQKMSIAMTVPFAIYFYCESAGFLKILGVFCAIASIVLANLKSKDLLAGTPTKAGEQGFVGGDANKGRSFEFRVSSSCPVRRPPSGINLLWVPIITFLLSVVIEVGFLKVNYEKWLPDGDVRFIATIFGTAGMLGLAVILGRYFMKKAVFSWKNVVAGIALGIPNYGSILFIFLALGSGMEGSVFFPANNVGIIVASALLAVLFFREKLSAINWAGVGLAVAAIVLIAMG